MTVKLGQKSPSLASFGHKAIGTISNIGHKAIHAIGNVGGAVGGLAAPLSLLATAAGQPEIGAGLMAASRVGGALGATNAALKKIGV